MRHATASDVFKSSKLPTCTENGGCECELAAAVVRAASLLATSSEEGFWREQNA